MQYILCAWFLKRKTYYIALVDIRIILTIKLSFRKILQVFFNIFICLFQIVMKYESLSWGLFIITLIKYVRICLYIQEKVVLVALWTTRLDFQEFDEH